MEEERGEKNLLEATGLFPLFASFSLERLHLPSARRHQHDHKLEVTFGNTAAVAAAAWGKEGSRQKRAIPCRSVRNQEGRASKRGNNNPPRPSKH